MIWLSANRAESFFPAEGPLGAKNMDSSSDRKAIVTKRLLSDLDCTIAAYRCAAMAAENAGNANAGQELSNKISARQKFEAALTRYNEYVITGIEPEEMDQDTHSINAAAGGGGSGQ